MAHSISSKKRIRQNAKRKARNRWRLKIMRTAIKDLEQKLLHGSTAEAQEAFKACAQIIDRSAHVGVLHKNQAARRKSRLNARVKAKATA